MLFSSELVIDLIVNQGNRIRIQNNSTKKTINFIIDFNLIADQIEPEIPSLMLKNQSDFYEENLLRKEQLAVLETSHGV